VALPHFKVDSFGDFWCQKANAGILKMTQLFWHFENDSAFWLQGQSTASEKNCVVIMNQEQHNLISQFFWSLTFS
jgi:hypothetical protein